MTALTSWTEIPLLKAARLLDNFDGPLALQQSAAYAIALEQQGALCIPLAWGDLDKPKALALLIRRQLFGAVTTDLVFRGPVWLRKPDDAEHRQSLSALKALARPLRWHFVIQMPELDDDPDTRRMLKAAKLRRVMTGFATSWVALANADLRAGLDGKWRNQLKKAENADLSISVGGKRAASYAWLLEKEAQQRQRRGYQAVPLGLVPNFVDAGKTLGYTHPTALSVTAMKAKSKVAGALFLLHGQSATYHIGWTNDDGRDLNAQNLVLWEGMLALAKQGVKHLDLGGINTADLAGITRFKLGLGGSVHRLAGSYI